MNGCYECSYFMNECEGDGACILDDDYEDERSGHEDWEIDPDMGDE